MGVDVPRDKKSHQKTYEMYTKPNMRTKTKGSDPDVDLDGLVDELVGAEHRGHGIPNALASF